ncbi:DegV family EDD domain-containing protein [candidate division KSB1 bacterium]|nr:DegV family EDD domain-containing protein [candidate division KSB1 bacterium]
MQIKYIDGNRLRNAILAGSEIVFKMRSHLNKINFFPIPDKDTGTNLSATLRNVVENLRGSSSASIDQVSQNLAEAALLGAQGNSGAILAQFFQGLAEELEGKIQVSARAFSQAVEGAAQKIYESLAAPVEGTILTVIKDWSAAVKASCQKSQDFVVVLRNALNEAKVSLAATRDKIDVLKKAGVVDAGAQGFVNLLEGISLFIEQGTIKDLFRDGVSDPYNMPLTTFTDFEADISHQFCVECLLVAKNLNKKDLQDRLVERGSSLAIATSKRFAKIHIHTNEPEAIKSILGALGEMQSFRVNDLIKQQQHALSVQKQARIALVTDSSCDLPHELITRYQVHVVPVRIHFGDETFIDKQTITPLEFYEKLQSSDIHPTTSQPTPADFKKMYERLAKRYDAILSIHLADRLSGTLKAAQTAAKYIENTRIVIVDSKTTSLALGLLMVEAGEAISAGMDIDQIAEKLMSIVRKLNIFINIPSLKYLVKGGRISKGKGLIATILNIKPVLTFDETGAIAEVTKAFGHFMSLRKTLKMVREETKDLKNVRIGIVHANAIGKAEWVSRKLADLPNLSSIITHDVAPVLGVHAGPGTIGVAYWGE